MRSMRWIFLVISIFAMFASPLTKVTFASVQYNVVALNALPGGLDTLAFGINETGQIVGDSRLNRSGNVGQSRPVVWDYTGAPHELWSDQSVGGSLIDINNHGEIVGRYGSGSDIPLPGPGVPYGRALYWSESTGRIDIGFESGGNSQAVAINDLGQVIGTSERLEIVNINGDIQPQFIPRPYIWDASSGIRDLGTLGGLGGFATGINESGQVTGYTELANGTTRGFIWDAANGIRELPTSPNSSSVATAINDFGQVLGYDFGVGAVIWDVMSGTSQPAYDGRDLNNSEQVVGGAIFDPTIWNKTMGVQQLSALIPPDSNWQLEIAFAINETNAIAGYGAFNGGLRGFVMLPIPEPDSLRLLLLCLPFISGLSLVQRRRP